MVLQVYTYLVFTMQHSSLFICKHQLNFGNVFETTNIKNIVFYLCHYFMVTLF